MLKSRAKRLKNQMQEIEATSTVFRDMAPPSISQNAQPLGFTKDRTHLHSQKLDPEKFTWVGFNAVATTSEHYGTSLEELSIASKHSSPLRGWESARFCEFPQSVVISLEQRSEIAHVMVRTKEHLSIPALEIHIGDGIGASFVDAKFREAGSAKMISGGHAVQVDTLGIGNYIKLVFNKPPQKTAQNPSGQVGIQTLRVWARPLGKGGWYGVKNEQTPLVGGNHGNQVDSILLQLGVPLGQTDWELAADGFQYAPVDDETRDLLVELDRMRLRSLQSGDYTQGSQLRSDMKILVDIGNNILKLKRELNLALSVQNYDEALRLKPQIEAWAKKRHVFEAMYETAAFEEGIELPEKPGEEEMPVAFAQQLANTQPVQDPTPPPPPPVVNTDPAEQPIFAGGGGEWTKSETKNGGELLQFDFSSETKSPKKKPKRFAKKEENKRESAVAMHSDMIKGEPLKYNEGDQELEPFFNPLLRQAGGSLQELEQDQLKRAFSRGVLTVTGARLWNALHSETWRHREAAVSAFLEYAGQDPLPMKWQEDPVKLFDATIEVAHVGFEDKLQQIYLKSLSLLDCAFKPPLLGPSISPKHRNGALRRFAPLLVQRVAELNYRSHDASLAVLLRIFQVPHADLRILIENIMDVTENESEPVSKVQTRLLTARLAILSGILDQFGDPTDDVFSWKAIFQLLVAPCLFHSSPDVRLAAVEVIASLYKQKGEEVRTQLHQIEGINHNLLETIERRISQIGKVPTTHSPPKAAKPLESVQETVQEHATSAHSFKRQTKSPSSPFRSPGKRDSSKGSDSRSPPRVKPVATATRKFLSSSPGRASPKFEEKKGAHPPALEPILNKKEESKRKKEEAALKKKEEEAEKKRAKAEAAEQKKLDKLKAEQQKKEAKEKAKAEAAEKKLQKKKK